MIIITNNNELKVLNMKIEHAQTIIESDKLKRLKELVAEDTKTLDISTKEALYQAADYYIEKHEMRRGKR